MQGSQLLYGRLPVNSLGEGEPCRAVCGHLGRPCIADAPSLLDDLAGDTGVDMTALWQSAPGQPQQLDCLATAVQDAVRESRAFWMELGAALVLKRAARPAWVVRRCSLTCTLHGREHTTRSRQAAHRNYMKISQGRGHEDEICKETSAESTCRWREA